MKGGEGGQKRDPAYDGLNTNLRTEYIDSQSQHVTVPITGGPCRAFREPSLRWRLCLETARWFVLFFLL